MVDTLKNLSTFQSPDYGIKGNPINEFRSFSQLNTTPGQAAQIDFLANSFGDHIDKNQPIREDDGKSGTRVAKVVYYEYVQVETVLNPIVSTMIKNSTTGDLTDEVLVVYAAPAGGSTAMLPTPEETMGPSVDLKRIYRFPKFYSIQREQAVLGQDCIVEYAGPDVHYGIFHGMVDDGVNTPAYDLGGASDFNAGNKTRGSIAGLFGKGGTGRVGNKSSNSNLSLSDMSAAMKARASGEKTKLVRVDADKVPGYDGYASFRLAANIAEKYNQLRQAVLGRGGVMTSAGGIRPLQSKTNSSRSALSLHYLGRAFDLALPTGMNNPERDPYVCVRDSNDPRRFIVWCRTQNSSVPVVRLEAEKITSKRGQTSISKQTVEGRFFNFTQLASQFGFKGIRGRKSFFRGGKYTGAEWWHFQNTDGLRLGQTTFGEELLSLYSLEKVQREFTYWNQAANKKYGNDWA